MADQSYKEVDGTMDESSDGASDLITLTVKSPKDKKDIKIAKASNVKQVFVIICTFNCVF